MVIHIQDAHENYEAQKNIARTIESLAKSYGPAGLPLNQDRESAQPSPQMVVGLEGAKGPFDFAPYRSFPDMRLNGEIAV